MSVFRDQAHYVIPLVSMSLC